MSQSQKTLKDDARSLLIRTHGYSSKVRALILLDISSADIRDFLRKVGENLNIGIIESTGSAEEKTHYIAYDAFLTDGVSGKLDVLSLVHSLVVPILPVENDFSPNFSEFDPMKFTGNAFLYEKTDIYHIFEKLIRYLENIRYAGDKRTLMENLKKTF